VPLGAKRPLLLVGKRTAGACIASSPDSDLEAFSHNPTHGSFAPLAFQPSAMNVRSCLGLFSLQFPATRTSWQRSFMPWLFFLAIPRDKDMLATFVHALGLFFLAIPRDKDMLATFVHALGIFSHLFFPNLLRSLEKGK
jgi:hypothetical protein